MVTSATTSMNAPLRQTAPVTLLPRALTMLAVSTANATMGLRVMVSCVPTLTSALRAPASVTPRAQLALTRLADMSARAILGTKVTAMYVLRLTNARLASTIVPMLPLASTPMAPSNARALVSAASPRRATTLPNTTTTVCLACRQVLLLPTQTLAATLATHLITATAGASMLIRVYATLPTIQRTRFLLMPSYRATLTTNAAILATALSVMM
eukprot:Rmarinus@m.22862